jgi:hypothetical protein
LYESRLRQPGIDIFSCAVRDWKISKNIRKHMTTSALLHDLEMAIHMLAQVIARRCQK